LLGAIDDHEGHLVHNRPWMADERTEALREMAAAWFEDVGENWVPSLVLAPGWLTAHLESLVDHARDIHSNALAFAEFIHWADAEGLTAPQ
jgi:hypothetical protein